MRAAEIVTELIRKPIPTFAEMAAKRNVVFVGEYTNVIGDFYEKLGVVINNPGLTSIAQVYTNQTEEDLRHTRTSFSKFFDVSDVKWYGQGNFGFEFSVADLTPDEYAELLEKSFHFLTLTRK